MAANQSNHDQTWSKNNINQKSIERNQTQSNITQESAISNSSMQSRSITSIDTFDWFDCNFHLSPDDVNRILSNRYS